MSNDLHNNMRVLRVVSPVTVGTTGTGKTGKVIDTQGFGGVEFIVSYGTVTATNAAFTIVVKDGTVTGTLVSVADEFLLGTEALSGLAAGTRTSGTTMNVTKRVGYVVTTKRYVNASISSTVTAGTPIAIDAVLHNPHVAPTDNP